MYRNKIRLDNPQAVQRLLGRTINQLLDKEETGMTESRAKTIGYLANILLSSFETVDMEQRLAELEAAINDRKPA